MDLEDTETAIRGWLESRGGVVDANFRHAPNDEDYGCQLIVELLPHRTEACACEIGYRQETNGDVWTYFFVERWSRLSTREDLRVDSHKPDYIGFGAEPSIIEEAALLDLLNAVSCGRVELTLSVRGDRLVGSCGRLANSNLSWRCIGLSGLPARVLSSMSMIEVRTLAFVDWGVGPENS